AAFRARVPHQVSGSRDDGKGRVRRGRVSGLLSRLRDRRRVLRLLPEVPRVLEDVRTAAAGLRAPKDLLRERAPGDPGDRSEPVSRERAVTNDRAPYGSARCALFAISATMSSISLGAVLIRSVPRSVTT